MDANNNNDADFHSDSAAEIGDVDSAMLDNHASAEFVAVSSAAFLESTQEVELPQITTMSGDDFVHSFSKINIFQIQISFARDVEATFRKTRTFWERSRPTNVVPLLLQKGLRKPLMESAGSR
jgi:hypothetical protein